MAVSVYDVEVTSAIPPATLFKAILNFDTLAPKIFPQAVTSFVTLEGDGGPGTIRQVNLSNGGYLKERIDAIDNENFKFAYTVIEGDALMNALEKISHEISYKATIDGGSICKRSSKYFTIGDVSTKEEEEIKASHEKAAELFISVSKAFEAYLLANPEAEN